MREKEFEVEVEVEVKVEVAVEVGAEEEHGRSRKSTNQNQLVLLLVVRLIAPLALVRSNILCNSVKKGPEARAAGIVKRMKRVGYAFSFFFAPRSLIGVGEKMNWSKLFFFSTRFPRSSSSFFRSQENDGDDARFGVSAVIVDSNDAAPSSSAANLQAYGQRGVLHFGAVNSPFTALQPTPAQFVVGLVPRRRPLHPREAQGHGAVVRGASRECRLIVSR